MSNPASPQDPWHVICLCAAWCGVCREWRAALLRVQAARPDMRFAWIDVEDDDDAMGDVDIETFPTLLIAEGDQPRFLGAIPPMEKRLLDQLTRLQSDPQSASVPAEAGPLLQRLKPLLHRAAL